VVTAITIPRAIILNIFYSSAFLRIKNSGAIMRGYRSADDALPEKNFKLRHYLLTGSLDSLFKKRNS
jgi:hypothetical protein